MSRRYCLGLLALTMLCTPAGAEEPPQLIDCWQGRAAWVKDQGNIGGDFAFHFLSFVAGGPEIFAYHIQNHVRPDGKFKMAIGRARGTDGIKWTDEGLVLDVGKDGAWDDRIASFPGTWKAGDTWYMVYEGAGEDRQMSPGDIGLATSRDGRTFVKHPANPILRHETTGWERANIGTPSLYREKGTWYLFYHGYDGNVCQIGVASGKDLTKLTKSPANPIIPVAPQATAWDSGTTGKRSAVMKQGQFYYIAYEGSTPPPFELARWSSGLARTTDLTAKWEKYPANPVLPQTPGGMGNDGPELLHLKNVWFMYVRHSPQPGKLASQRFRLDAIKNPTAP